MVRAASLLAGRRIHAFVALAAANVAYMLAAGRLPDLPPGWDAVLLGAVLLPALFSLVWLALPLRRARGLLPLALALGTVAVLAELGDLRVLTNATKFAAVTIFAFWFLTFFQDVAWVTIVALIIPFVDAYSVWRGPTGNIVENHPGTFGYLSHAFWLPGWDDGLTAQIARLGLPDVLFFALFLAAADAFRLRVGWTFLCMLAALGLTIVLALEFDTGLPALPAIAAGFLLPNADLLWRNLRRIQLR